MGIGSDLFLFYFILRVRFGTLIGFGCNGIGRCGVLYTLYQPCMNISVLERVCSVYWPPYELQLDSLVCYEYGGLRVH